MKYATRIFACSMPTGVWYSDRFHMKHGDYKKLGWISYATLEITIFPDCPSDLAAEISADMEAIAARKGELYPISTTQNITLGYARAYPSTHPTKEITMGTRSITHIHEAHTGEEEIVCSFYRHWDGYPEGHGKDLQDWLNGKRLINGIGADFVIGRDFNRAGTMAVQLMAHIQNMSGCEVIPTGDKDYGEDYVYHIYFRNGVFEVIVN